MQAWEMGLCTDCHTIVGTGFLRESSHRARSCEVLSGSPAGGARASPRAAQKESSMFEAAWLLLPNLGLTSSKL